MSTSKHAGKIRVGVIGASPGRSWASLTHLPVLKTLPGYELTAVSTTRQQSADETARAFGVPHAFDDARKLAEHPDVDLVVVSVRTPEHDRLVRTALAARKDVFCEWPLGTSTAQATALRDLAAATGVRTLIGLQRRLAPSIRYLRDLVADGYIGKVRSATIDASTAMLGAEITASSAYTADAANGANVHTIYTAHFLDLLLASLGDLRDLSAIVARQFDQATIAETGQVIPVTAPDQVLLAGTFTSGAVLSAHFEGGKRNGSRIAYTITGTEGDLALSDDLTLSGAQGSGNPLKPLPIPERYEWLPPSDVSTSAKEIGNVYAAFQRDLAEGTHTAPTFDDALTLHHLIDTIAEASRTGQRTPWNPRAS
ncbi:Gfo/Idh/MocA family protein [Chondromyces apiculatus]|uniref:Putative oxidoreductase n=1 Tax=Chondromyces apiculatus DSM 436 TaxID=1192034 RepID=A0A017TA05_9BACT|nr:Gfo/Idh/MocA family oxidoreductase [Chondromyces apiculatus]EYF05772.1 putative oxidoreductase [Chondromyces apiculatus DSM 436]